MFANFIPQSLYVSMRYTTRLSMHFQEKACMHLTLSALELKCSNPFYMLQKIANAAADADNLSRSRV